ncbi:Slp family lipoprotein [Geotalea sp. SG265]|uniref:Slp family lipoprotein n=1 Tax=Geotalea sp. SG265 TaxID=2922867 RepID=UPI001FAEE9DF|nr:Slp family lipoprotein [Geotalea sp. SG265]
MKKSMILPVLIMVVILAGCTHVISEGARKRVDSTISFSDVKKRADSFIGKQILVGGKIAVVRNTKGTGQMEVVQFSIDTSGYPIETSQSGGRFIATSADFLDPIIYKTGRLITMTGEVKGQKSGTIDGAEYTFPVIGIKEIFTWKMNDDEKSPSSAFYNNYNPYEYNHDTPLLYRPTGPVIK